MHPEEIIDKLKQPKIYFPLSLLVIFLGIGSIVAVQKIFNDNNQAQFKFLDLLKANNQAGKKIDSPLDGKIYPENDAQRHALGVIVENHPDARPQFGLIEASVVYEAVAEGGITRFLAIFGPKLPSKVGPVRSARTYYLDWCLEYDCFFSHVGGNIDALDLIPKLAIKDLDQFRYGVSKYGKTYYRVPKPGVASEHTMYVEPTKLYDIAKNNKWPLTGDFPKIKFKQESKESDRPASAEVKIEISSQSYNTQWTYDRKSNTYARIMGGVPHLDGSSNQQIKSSVLIVQEVINKPIVTRINEQGMQFTTVGNGKAKIFQDGKSIEATWKKTSQQTATKFLDENSNEIKFIPGQRWITVVNPGTPITVN